MSIRALHLTRGGSTALVSERYGIRRGLVNLTFASEWADRVIVEGRDTGAAAGSRRIQ